ncbi:MAG TPA: hypothetical protein VE645_02490 [Pseudonocardiaceae bacterium]|jgi:hypothetical protein|nr:hypothetical protein [Pseudonocardiaceae bacterium]
MAGKRRKVNPRTARTSGATAPPRLIAMVDATTGTAHRVTDESIAAGRRAGGIYVAVCGAQVLAASLTMPERDQCQPCQACTRESR